MADSKLTDLPEVTTIADNDVLYLANVSLNQSNKITYANLINTKFVAINTAFEAVSASVDTLNSQFPNIRNEVLAQTAREGFFTVNFGNSNLANGSQILTTFSFCPDNNASNVLSATLPATFNVGDILTPALTLAGGSSGLQVFATPLSANAVTLTIRNNTGSVQHLSGNNVTPALYFKVDYNRST